LGYKQTKETKKSLAEDPLEQLLEIVKSFEQKTNFNRKDVEKELRKPIKSILEGLREKDAKGKLTKSEDDAMLIASRMLERLEKAEGYKADLDYKDSIYLVIANAEWMISNAGITKKEETKKTEWFEATQQEKQKVREYIESYVETVLSRSISPTGFYGSTKNDDRPLWADGLIDDATSLPPVSPQDLQAIIGNVFAKYKGTKYYNILRLELGSASNATDLARGLRALTSTQRIIDGISISMKSLYLGRVTSTEELRTLFGDMLTESELRFLSGESKKGDFAAIVRKLLPDNSENSGMVQIAIDASFGENAGILDWLLDDMKVPGYKSLGSIGKLREFYLAAADSLQKGGTYSKLWSAAENKLPTTTSHLKGDTSYVPPSTDPTAALLRDNYDIATLMSFLYASGRSSYFKYLKSHRGGDELANAFLKTIGGSDGTMLPTPVIATLLQNYKTTDFLFENLRKDYEGFSSLMGDIAGKTAVIYSQRFGAAFNENYSTVRTRKEAAYFFMAQIAALPDDSLLSDMVARLLDSNRPPIKLTNLQTLITVVPLQQDFDNIAQRLNNYIARQPDFRDLNEYYKSTREYFNSRAPGISQQTPEDAEFNLGLLNLPQTFESGVQGIYSNLMSYRELFKLNNVSGQGFLTGQETETLTTDGSGNLQLFGPTGYITTSANYQSDLQRNSETGQDIQKDLALQMNANAQNVSMGALNIYELFANWTKDIQKSGQDLEVVKVEDESYNLRLKALSPYGDLVLLAQEDNTPSSYFRNFDAYIYRGDSWYRVKTEKFENTENDFSKVLQDNYAEFAQWFTPIRTQIGVEQQKLDGKTDLERIGYFAGFENSKTDTRLSSLFAKTASSNQLFMSSVGIDMRSGRQSRVKPKVVSFGFIDLKNEETDIEGRTLQQSGIYDPSGQIKPEHRVWLASYKVVDKLYALAMGGEDIAGLRLETKKAGFGGLMKFNQGVEHFFGSGRYASTTFEANAYLDYKNKEQYLGSALLRIKLGEDVYLNITGTKASGSLNLLNANAQTSRQLAQEFQDLMEDMNSTTSSEKWKEEGKNYAFKQQKTEEWTQRTLDLLEKVRLYVPSSFLSDLRTEFSVGLEAPGFTGKLSLDKIASQSSGEESDLYFVSMTDFKNISFTAGVRLGEDMTGNRITNFAGMKFTEGSTVFGITGYNFFSPDQSEAFTVAHYFDDGFIARFDAKLLDAAKGYDLAVFVGNQKVKITLGKEKIKDLSSYRSAILVSLGQESPWFVGSGFRYTEAGPLIMREPSITLGYTAKSGFNATLKGTVIDATAGSGHFRTFDVRLNFSVPLGR